MGIGHLIALQKRLENKSLTLSQLRSLEDEAMLLESEPNASFEIFEKIQEKRELLLRKTRGDTSLWETGLSSLKKKAQEIEDIEFSLQEPLAHELDGNAMASTFATRMLYIAKMVRNQNSLTSYNKNLNGTQKKNIAQISGKNPTPERLSRAVHSYVHGLRQQMEVAQSFYFGRVKEGMEKLSKLSCMVRQRVDELVWQSGQGERQVPPQVVIAAIMHSVEEQMGMHEKTG